MPSPDEGVAPVSTNFGIDSLVEAYLSKGHESQRSSCSPLAMRLLQAYHWPGNVRELHAVMESSMVRAAGTRIEAQHLPEEVRA